MDRLERFGVSMNGELLEAFDRLIRQKGYTSRSEAIRDIVRDYLVGQEWEEQEREVIGTITLVYDHHRRDLADALTEVQHQHHDAIICSNHVHLDEYNCLESVVVRGPSSVVRAIADRLITIKGVKHGKLVCTTTGADLR